MMSFMIGYEAELHTEDKDFPSSEPGSKNIYLEDFHKIFCPEKLQGINCSWNCHILWTMVMDGVGSR